jgi:leucyl-tRNA synthetase
MVFNQKKIEKKWQDRWEKERVFEANPDKRKKFFVNFPYPYINAYQHIGHFYTLMRIEAFARYKRLKGFNVLFPQAWHATGSPIINAAKRIRDKEPKQMKIMKDMKIPASKIKKFENSEYWLEFFAPEYKKDYKAMGISVDWRREFYTTSLNPHYDKFIKWQFRKLKKKNYCIQGKFPVVWDPKENVAVGDHDRVEGEGETPQEFTLLKYRLGDKYLVCATLRPETVYGQTNLWIGPENEYVLAGVDGEKWVLSEQCADKLKEQDKEVKIVKKIKGGELLGKKVVAPMIGREIPILPADFCDLDKGTGIVTSVPSDAPDDYIGLRDLWENKKECEKYGLDYDEVKKIEVIPIIDSEDLGDKAAVKVVEDMKIKNQQEREKLEEAKKLVYKKGFYEGKMNKNCGKYAGMPVQEAKDKVKDELTDIGDADRLYELTGKVVSRSLAECIVKIVENQWFLDYSNAEWKKKAHECLNGLKLYPEKSRQQFNYVIDWLHEWACTREEGLGTRLPWDEKWLIESLSDSTIYMAYYTIVHLLKEVDAEKIDDKFFDYVFLGKGEKPEIKNIEKMREEFKYWYPFDFRNSGKDLIQNHLTFLLFNHVAIFPKKYWPKGIGVNGWVTVDGQKMSKSLGNMIPVRDMAKDFGADVSRLTILSGGEGMDDPNWDSNMAKSLELKFNNIYSVITSYYGKGSEILTDSDRLAESRFNSLLMETEPLMEETLFRSAIQKIFFDFWKIIKDYLNRVNNKPNKDVFDSLAENFLIMLSPFCPHLAEEIWEIIGKKKMIFSAKWPEAEEGKIDGKLEEREAQVEKTVADINNILSILKEKEGKEGERIYLYVMPFEIGNYNEAILGKRLNRIVKVFAVNDSEKHDPENKSKKAKPGKPGIYIE